MATQLHLLHPLHSLPRPLKTLKPKTIYIHKPKLSAIATAKLRVAVIGGGPAGSSAAEAMAAGGVETFLFERSPATAKPCGGAIPLCMLEEFSIPTALIDRRVTQMRIVSPSNLVVDFGKTLKQDEFIAMLRREVLDSFLRNRAESSGAILVKALVTKLEVPNSRTPPSGEDPRASCSGGGRSGVRDKMLRRRDIFRGQERKNVRRSNREGVGGRGEDDQRRGFEEGVFEEVG